MAKLLIEYDTVPLGKKNDVVNIPEEISELLQDYYLYFSYVQKIENRDSDYANNYEFVPVYRKGKVEFNLFRKNNVDYRKKSIAKGIRILNTYLYQ